MPYTVFQYLLIILLIAFIPTEGMSQQLERQEFPVSKDGQLLPLGLVGGISNPQFSAIDFNQDGFDDLYAFDRSGDVHLGFIHTEGMGSTTYTFDAMATRNFPLSEFWVLLRDYDGDGLQDIFSYSNQPGVPGMQVFKGRLENGNYVFDPYLTTPTNFNLLLYEINGLKPVIYVGGKELPSIDDIDGDGDLDILAYDLNGVHVHYFQNQSIERGHGRDSLIFTLKDDCWGKFLEDGDKPPVLLSSQSSECATGFTSNDVEDRGPRHGGASSLMTYDKDGDGDKDLLLGDLSFTSMNMLTNGGSRSSAFITEQEIDFPINSTAIDIQFMSGAYHVDVDQDGQRDLLCSPMLPRFENIEVGWYYYNSGTDDRPVFELQQKNFLSEKMINLGTGTAPAIVDYNADQLPDLVVGTIGVYGADSLPQGRIVLFENIGTPTAPAFRLADDDWLNFSRQHPSGFGAYTPTFGDMDGDGDMDLLVGEINGGLFYAENTAGPGQPFDFPSVNYGYMGIDVGSGLEIYSAPTIGDLNADGLPDLLIGERMGNLNYYQNIGTATEPQFDPNPTAGANTDSYGDIALQMPDPFNVGFTAPLLLDIGNAQRLLVGTERIGIRNYGDISGPISGPLVHQNSTFEQLRSEGHRLYADMGDLNNDGQLEMVVGNRRGGLSIFSSNWKEDGEVVATQEPDNQTSLTLFPNPAQEELRMEWLSERNNDWTVRIMDVNGRVMMETKQVSSPYRLDLRGLSAGLYICELRSAKHLVVQKFLKK